MVESVGQSTTSDSAVSRVAATTPVARTTPVATTPTPAPPSQAAPQAAQQEAAQVGGLAASLAASPPVDADRVATIKKAIADGRFPIFPATIADRLIALKLQWKPGDDR